MGNKVFCYFNHKQDDALHIKDEEKLFIDTVLFRTQLKKATIDQEFVKKLNQNQWVVSLKNEYKDRWFKILQNAKEVNIQSLCLSFNNWSLSLLQISHIKMSNLLYLWLGDNNITNIQPLQQLNTNCLKTLSLTSNHVCNIKVFAKSKFKDLTYLDLTQNKITCLEPLSKMKLVIKTEQQNREEKNRNDDQQEAGNAFFGDQKRLSIRLQNYRDAQAQFQNLSNFGKLHKNCFFLHSKNSSRICQAKVNLIMQKRLNNSVSRQQI